MRKRFVSVLAAAACWLAPLGTPVRGADGAAARPPVGELSMERLLEEFHHPEAFLSHPLPQRTVDVINALRKMGTPLLEKLKTDLNSPDAGVRVAAARVLASLGEAAREAVPELVACLSDTEARVRRGAIMALGELRDPRAFRPLLRAAEDPSFLVRIAIVRSAGPSLEDARFAMNVLALSDEAPHVRRAALEELRLLDDKRAVPHVVPLLEDRASLYAGTGPRARTAERVCDAAALALERLAGGRWVVSGEGPPDERDARVAKWRAWWGENRDAYLAEVYPRKDLERATH